MLSRRQSSGGLRSTGSDALKPRNLASKRIAAERKQLLTLKTLSERDAGFAEEPGRGRGAVGG
jgi:hypothetical protein